MKIQNLLKYVTVILMAIGLMLLYPIMSTANSVAFAPKADKQIIVDGKLDEWNKSAPLILAEQSQMIRDGEIWGGPMDLSAKVYVMWDEKNLYIGADVIEDTPFRSAEMLPLDRQDSFILHLSTNPSADVARKSYEGTDFRVILLIDNDYWDTAIDRNMLTDGKGINTKGMNGGESVLNGYHRATQQTTLGFTFEAIIPWSNFVSAVLPLYMPKVNDRLGFDFVITDTQYPCPGEEYVPQIAWSGNSTLAENPSVWGAIILK